MNSILSSINASRKIIRLAAIKSKDGSQQYKNENTVFGVFCVDLLSRELSKTHHSEFCALVYGALFHFELWSRIW